MKLLMKRTFAIFMAVVMCLFTGVTSFAAETQPTEKAKCYNLEVSSTGVIFCTDENGNEVPYISPRSSISGYGNDSISTENPAIVIYPDASGIGGMGITVKTSSSWNGYMKLIAGAQYMGSISTIINNYAVYSNGETYFNNIMHSFPGYIVFVFDGIPSGVIVNTQIWIYG